MVQFTACMRSTGAVALPPCMQVDQLQSMVEQMWSMYRQQAASQEAAATQTDIVAVHTPDCEEAATFPFQRPGRPSSLAIPQRAHAPQPAPDITAPQELRQFATSLVDGVLRTMAEPK
ncbi:hypothetical protein PR048_000489 [Dryococelus australis]|uniref:Uncharacterized protein n=1 Tax=Dryococelus australis TaxID=614101 RepID=A0ABQ9IFZ1_9NEOP|nr:hypothetical protein PR048_000489 [Dryococelus australis]